MTKRQTLTAKGWKKKRSELTSKGWKRKRSESSINQFIKSVKRFSFGYPSLYRRKILLWNQP